MKKRKILRIAVIGFFLCLAIFTTAAGAKEQKKAAILFSHDMHSHLETTYVEQDGKQREEGGFAKIKYAIDREREASPDTLVVDAGDFSMGTLYQTIFEERAPELVLLGRMGYDAVTLGNHEFDYRSGGLANMLRSAAGEGMLPSLVMANIDWSKSDGGEALDLKNALEEAGAAEYRMFLKGNVRIAVFGMMGRDADECAPLSGLAFEDMTVCAKRIVEEIKTKEAPDLIICLSHGGTWEDKKKSEDEILAKEVPDIDVIISGHTHTALAQPIIQGNTVIASAGEYGRNLGRMELVQKEDGRWTLEEYSLLAMDETIEEDASVMEQIKAFKKEVQASYLDSFGYEFDEVLAVSPFSFIPFEDFGDEQGEDPLGSLIADSYIYAVEQAEGDSYEKVDVSVVPSGIVRDSIRKGEVKVSDVFSISSLGIGEDGVPGYPLVSVYLTGKELKTAAEVDISVSPAMSAARLYMSGLSYTYNPNRLILNRVTEVRAEPERGRYEELDDKRLYRVVADLYSAQMLSAVEETSFGLLAVTPKDKEGKPITDFAAAIIRNETGEVKEWAALASYLSSFPKENGISVLPAYYRETDGRKIQVDSKNIVELLKKPNQFFVLAAGAVIVLLAAAVLLACFFLKRRKGGRKHRGRA